MDNTKVLSAIFNAALAGLAVCLFMTIYTAVENHKSTPKIEPASIPTPVLGK